MSKFLKGISKICISFNQTLTQQHKKITPIPRVWDHLKVNWKSLGDNWPWYWFNEQIQLLVMCLWSLYFGINLPLLHFVGAYNLPTIPFSMSSLDFAGEFGLLMALSYFVVGQGFYFKLCLLPRLLFLQLSCLDFPVGFGLLWPTTGCHGLPSCFLSLFRFWDSPAVWKIYKSNNKLCPCLCLCLCLCPQ